MSYYYEDTSYYCYSVPAHYEDTIDYDDSVPAAPTHDDDTPLYDDNAQPDILYYDEDIYPCNSSHLVEPVELYCEDEIHPAYRDHEDLISPTIQHSTTNITVDEPPHDSDVTASIGPFTENCQWDRYNTY